MGNIYAGALVGSVGGLFLFIIVKFWILPILRFRKIKTEIKKGVGKYCNMISCEIKDEDCKNDIAALQKIIRTLSMNLSESYNHDIPYWYRLKLESSGQAVLNAAKDLMGLAGTISYPHAIQRMKKLRKDLKIS